jgi:hypothetical protein
MTPRLELLLTRLAPVVREEMLKVAVPNCCIATVAVLRRVFRHHGFEARGVPVAVTIRNRKMLEALAKGIPIPDDPKALHKWMEATGSWSIGILPESALESRARGYDAFGGHLVCHVQDTLVDASLDQANRPEHDIKLLPFIAVETSPEFLAGKQMLVGKVNGCEVTYRPLRTSEWRKSADWIEERRYRATVNAIIERAKL